jgi:hypothetical protein
MLFDYPGIRLAAVASKGFLYGVRPLVWMAEKRLARAASRA